MSKAAIARQLWIRAPGEAEIREERLPPPGADEVLVRTLYSGISRGTESLVFRGKVPASQYEAMRAPFQEGDFPGPLKYGYASVGEVVEGPAALAGRPVFCLYPHQDLYVAPVAAVTPLPPGLPPGRAVLAASMETAVNVLWDAAPAVGDRVVVIGAGVIGMLVARLCAAVPGARLTVVDVNPARHGVAGELGLELVTRPPDEADADLVVHASGQPGGLRDALEAAGAEGTVVEASWYGDRPVELPLGESFHSRRLTIRSSQVGRVPPQRAPRWSRRRRMRLALDLLQEPCLDALISGESPFAELPQVLERLSRDPGNALCHRIRYTEVD